jgi:hypothetical protein
MPLDINTFTTPVAVSASSSGLVVLAKSRPLDFLV